jgi:hypothetical protein
MSSSAYRDRRITANIGEGEIRDVDGAGELDFVHTPSELQDGAQVSAELSRKKSPSAPPVSGWEPIPPRLEHQFQLL